MVSKKALMGCFAGVGLAALVGVNTDYKSGHLDLPDAPPRQVVETTYETPHMEVFGKKLGKKSYDVQVVPEQVPPGSCVSEVYQNIKNKFANTDDSVPMTRLESALFEEANHEWKGENNPYAVEPGEPIYAILKKCN
ncbi:MAG: hypothetical protein ACOCZ6_03245 [Nanoarchaeota archaeon]